MNTLHFNFPPGVDLMQFLHQQFKPVRYLHVASQTMYLVVSEGEYRLHAFSDAGSVHDLIVAGRPVKAEMRYSGRDDPTWPEPVKYAGPITVYMGQDGRFWICPTYEFHDGRFVKEEE